MEKFIELVERLLDYVNKIDLSLQLLTRLNLVIHEIGHPTII
jgi:hypothetical protein